MKTTEVNIYNTKNRNDALMDSDLGSLKGNPTSTLSDSWIPKGSVAFNPVVPTGVTVVNKDIQFSPVQVAADKGVYVDFIINLILDVTTTSGATGTSNISIALSDFSGITPVGIQASCSRDSNGSGYPVIGCVPSGNTNLNNITISLWNASGTAKTYTTRMNLTIYGQITNTDFGFGQLFPKVEIK